MLSWGIQSVDRQLQSPVKHEGRQWGKWCDHYTVADRDKNQHKTGLNQQNRLVHSLGSPGWWIQEPDYIIRTISLHLLDPPPSLFWLLSLPLKMAMSSVCGEYHTRQAWPQSEQAALLTLPVNSQERTSITSWCYRTSQNQVCGKGFRMGPGHCPLLWSGEIDWLW